MLILNRETCQGRVVRKPSQPYMTLDKLGKFTFTASAVDLMNLHLNDGLELFIDAGQLFIHKSLADQSFVLRNQAKGNKSSMLCFTAGALQLAVLQYLHLTLQEQQRLLRFLIVPTNREPRAGFLVYEVKLQEDQDNG